MKSRYTPTGISRSLGLLLRHPYRHRHPRNRRWVEYVLRFQDPRKPYLGRRMGMTGTPENYRAYLWPMEPLEIAHLGLSLIHI